MARNSSQKFCLSFCGTLGCLKLYRTQCGTGGWNSAKLWGPSVIRPMRGQQQGGNNWPGPGHFQPLARAQARRRPPRGVWGKAFSLWAIPGPVHARAAAPAPPAPAENENSGPFFVGRRPFSGPRAIPLGPRLFCRPSALRPAHFIMANSKLNRFSEELLAALLGSSLFYIRGSGSSVLNSHSINSAPKFIKGKFRLAKLIS